MGSLTDYLDANGTALLVFFAGLFTLAALTQWVCWIFGWGRFKRSDSGATGARKPDDRALRFIFSEAVVKIINDFRHLLALILVLIFALSLAYLLYRSSTIAEMRESIQIVAASLGGLVGSIIGYYFGESSSANALPTDRFPRGGAATGDPAVQAPEPADDPEGGGMEGLSIAAPTPAPTPNITPAAGVPDADPSDDP